MAEYMVERYLPGVTQQAFEALRERIASAAADVATTGADVRYLGSTLVPEEESCFCRFESADADAVRRACEQAGVPYARIVETRHFAPAKEER
jgi:uncharacterized protein YbjT (DUF2867 family)